MLVEIARQPTAENSAIHLHPADNVAIARVPLAPGAALVVDGAQVTVREPVAPGHKIALAPIPSGSLVRRYGETIGRATADIPSGGHVHVHNLGYEELQPAYEFPKGERALPEVRDTPTFPGYPREDGRVGTRNYVAVIAASNCASHTAELIARSYERETLPAGVDGVVVFPMADGCGHAAGPDVEQLRRTMSGVLAHPNVSAALMVGLGCEDNQVEYYFGPQGPKRARLKALTLQTSGGTAGTLEAARREIAPLLGRAAAEKRVPVPASKIVLGLNCGGSDSFSGITANPALGVCSDMLAALGGTPVLAETPEIVGAEHLLIRRARNRRVAERILGFIRFYDGYLKMFGHSFNNNPSPGNKEGGITNILEKSLGAVAKAGTSVVTDALEYSERITTPGCNFMNTPGYDPPSLAGLAAGGCNMIVFTTGRGSAIGFPTIPVIKVSSNSATGRAMAGNIDVNAGSIADGNRTLSEVGREIFDLMLRVAGGERSRAETLGHREFVPWRIGPVV